MPIQSNISVKKLQLYLLPILFIIVAALVGIFVGYSSYTGIKALQAERDFSTTQLNDLVVKRQKLESVASLSSTLEENLVLARKAVPDSTEIPALLSQVQQISSEAGLVLSSLQYSGSGSYSGSGDTKSNQDRKIVVQTSIEGSYFQIIQLLEFIESARRIVQVDSVKISAASGETSNVLVANLALSGFYQKPKDFVAAAVSVDSDFRDGKLSKVIELLRSFREYIPKEVVEIAPVVEEEPVVTETPVEEAPL